MRRSVLLTLGILLLATSVWLALPPTVEASSGKIIYFFAGGADGAYPKSDLIVDAAGNLYGTTSAGGTLGGGTVFELIRGKDGWQHQVLYSFPGSPDEGPNAGLVFDSMGNLYGTTAGGGNSNCKRSFCGMVFKLTRNSRGGWTESVLHTFNGPNGDGSHPNTDLVFDGQGNLYGTTQSDPNTGCSCGTVFRLTPNPDGTWTENTIYVFLGAPDGAVPASAVIPNVDGSIYGTTAYGGTGRCNPNSGRYDPPPGCGTLYKLTPSGGGWTETVIYSFFRGQGFARNPSGGLILDKSGRFFGTSSYGGNGEGTFFQIEQMQKDGGQSILYRFYGNPDGENPVGRLAMGPQGNLFGATAHGGPDRAGTVFEIKRTNRGWKEHVIFDLGSTGIDQAGPTVDSQGHIYGTIGISNKFGAVYEVIP